MTWHGFESKCNDLVIQSWLSTFYLRYVFYLLQNDHGCTPCVYFWTSDLTMWGPERELYKTEQISGRTEKCMIFSTPFHTDHYFQTRRAHVHPDKCALSRGRHNTIVACYLFVIRADRIRHHLPASLSGSFPLRIFIRSKLYSAIQPEKPFRLSLLSLNDYTT